jgi:Uncharacterized conserved protein
MLIVGSVLMLVYMIKKVRKSKLQIEYTVFWIIFGVLLIIISLFPQIMYLLAKVIGVQSPVNLVLTFIIFILVLKLFMMTTEISELEVMIKELVEEMALKEKKNDINEE